MININRKSQGMPINVIIIAALALIVLVVIILIFTGRTKIFSEDLQSCPGRQGRCSEKPCESNEAFIPNTDCTKLAKEKQSKDDKCCVQVFNK